MPLSFLAPVFLAGLAALAIPVLIHLAHRPRKEVVRFPSLMFLERVEYRDASRRRLRHIVLFLLRSLALVLLAAAFARPFVDRPDAAAAAPDGGREVVVLLDRSESMATGDRMERAQAAVDQVAETLRRGDRATVVAFDRDAAALNRATDQAGALRTAARAVEPGAGSTRLIPALRLAESLLAGSPLPRRELVVVSDFQRSGWEAEEAPRMPTGTDVRLVDVGAPVRNVFVGAVEFGRERFSGRDRVRVSAMVAARSGDGGGSDPGDGPGGPGGDAVAGAALDVPVELVLDGRTVAARTVQVPVGGAATVAFDPVTLPDRAVRGTVRAGTDAMPADNARHFVLSASRSLRVLVATPRTGAASPYLERALAVGPDHEVATVRADRLGADALAGVDVAVLIGEPPADALDRLEGWVEAGGGAIVVLGPGSRARSWTGRSLLPGSLEGTRDGGDGGFGLTSLTLDHPVFAPFRDRTGALSATRFFRYRELEPAPEAGVLARYDDGGAAVVETAVGLGRAVVLTSSLDGAWSDLVLQPGFVPLVHRLVRHASGREAEAPWRTVGDLFAAGAGLAGDPDPDAEAGAAPALITPSDEALPVRPDSLYRLTERGFYEVRDPRTGADAVVVAVNGDLAESDPARVDTAEVRARIGAEPPAVMAASFAREDRERRQSLWWYFLAGAFVLMAAETALSNVLSRRPLPRVEEREAT